MATNNSTILNRIWISGSNDFQQRVPEPTQQNIAQVMDAILAPMNRDIYNQFCDALINRVGMTIVNNKRWDNPLAVFKKGTLSYGKTIQELAPMWIKAHAYQDAAETLLKVNRPDFAQVFYSVNREDKYPISINYDELRQAFTDEFGLNQLIDSALAAQMNSDNYDEYIIMKQLVAEYEHNWGFFKENLSAAPTNEATAKELVTKVRSYAGKLKFPSTTYNAGLYPQLPVFEQDSTKLVLLVTPEVNAVLDVEVLAYAFNMNKADVPFRVVEVDEFPIPNAVAMLTTEDFFVCYDYVYQTTSFYNPETLGTNYWLHHWSLLSASPLVPAILFTTAQGTSIPVVTEAVTGVTVTADSDTISAGETVQLTVSLDGTVDVVGKGITVKPNSVVWTIESADAPLNSRTYVDRNNVLHTQKSLEATDTLTVTGIATYINPSGATTTYSDSTTITIE